MFLRSQVADARRKTLAALARRDVLISCDRPLITFSFDDFPRTALTVGGAILQDSGVRGTYYTAPGLINTRNHLGEHFCSDDLLNLLAAGHELATHTYSHVSARKLGLGSYLREVEKGYQTLAGMPGLHVTRQFSYPFGDLTLRVKRAVAAKMQSCRGVYPGLNGPRVDLNLLRANRLCGDTAGLSAAEALIEENSRAKSWLIFYTHDVRPDPSPYGCAPALLEGVLRAAVRSGVRVVTVAEAMALARPV